MPVIDIFCYYRSSVDHIENQWIDTGGAVMLMGSSLLLALNIVVKKVTNIGLKPIRSAWLRSILALCVCCFVNTLEGYFICPRKVNLRWGPILSLLFVFAFVFLFGLRLHFCVGHNCVVLPNSHLVGHQCPYSFTEQGFDQSAAASFRNCYA